MIKWLLIGAAVVVAAVVAVVIVLLSSVDTVVQTAVEEFGSRATKTTVTLDEVDISSSGVGALRGFTLGNPQGFKTDSAARLGEIKVDIDIGSVTEDTVIIREIAINAPQITYELGPGGSNIDVIRRNVAAFTGAGGGKGGGGEKAEGGRKLIIQNLIIRDGKISVSATFLKGKTMTVPLPAIHLKDIGKEKGGASPGEVVDKIMAEVSKGAAGAVSSLGLGKAMDAATQGAEGMKKALEEGAGGAQEAIEKGAGSVGGALKGLFGK